MNKAETRFFLFEDQTKEEHIQAFIGHVFIDKQFFVLLQAAAQESHKISML